MTLQEYLLSKLAEECSELAQIAIKTQLFGLDSYDPNDPNKTTNIVLMSNEVNDLSNILDLLELMGVDLPPDPERTARKATQVIDMYKQHLDKGK